MDIMLTSQYFSQYNSTFHRVNSVYRITCRGRAIFLGSLSSSSSPSCLDTSSQVYLSMIPTSSRGIRNETRSVRHRPSFVASGFPQCSTDKTPWGLWGGRSAPNISLKSHNVLYEILTRCKTGTVNYRIIRNSHSLFLQNSIITTTKNKA
jgi:hypothetical protein